MYKVSLLYCLLVLILLMGCNDKDSPQVKEDYKFFNLRQQGWKSQRITHFINEINYTATEVPIHYYLLKNLGEDYKKVDSVYQVNSRERIVEIEFQHLDQEDLLQEEFTKKSYEEAVKYMAFAIEKDFTVITSSNDTIQCSGALFERNFKVAPFKRALLYFDNINPEDNIRLIYQDYLFGNGIVKFNFQETPIKL